MVFLHGGPGAGRRRRIAAFSIPKLAHHHFRSARCRPFAAARRNAQQHDRASDQDIEALRQDRGIERWHIFGGSWGSTLAIAYAEEHPERCLGLMLRGICLMRKREIEWFLYGMRISFRKPGKASPISCPAESATICWTPIADFRRQRRDKRKLEAIRIWAQL